MLHYSPVGCTQGDNYVCGRHSIHVVHVAGVLLLVDVCGATVLCLCDINDECANRNGNTGLVHIQATELHISLCSMGHICGQILHCHFNFNAYRLEESKEVLVAGVGCIQSVYPSSADVIREEVHGSFVVFAPIVVVKCQIEDPFTIDDGCGTCRNVLIVRGGEHEG